MRSNKFYSSNLNAALAFVCVTVYTLGVGLILWHAFFNNNPIANFIEKNLAVTSLPQ